MNILTKKNISTVGSLIFILFFVFVNKVWAVSMEYIGPGSYGADMAGVVSSDGRYVIVGDTVYDTVLNTSEGFHFNSSGVAGDGSITGSIPSISDDGRYVLFKSTSTNLDSITADTNGVADLFLRDLVLDTTERVNVSSAEVEANATPVWFQISGNGRYAIFDTTADNLVAGDTNSLEDVFIRDLDAGTTTLVSSDSGGTIGDGGSRQGSPSYDGRYVAFASLSTNLVPGYTSGAFHVYVKDTTTGDIEIVSIDDIGTEGDGSSRNPFMSGDSRYVAFESTSENLVTGDVNGTFDIFVYDRDTDTIEMVSKNNSGVQGDGASFDTSISYDGRYVSFWSNSTNFATVTAGENIFSYDRKLDIIELVSQSTAGVPGNVSTRYGSISSDGLHVAFSSGSTNLVSGEGPGIYLRTSNNFPTDISLSNSSINENENIGVTVGVLSTTDADSGDTHTYSFACSTPGVDDSSFSISGSNLLSAETFDYETKNSYSICVRTDDGNGGTYDKNFTISIVDVGESRGGSAGGGGGTVVVNPTPPPVTPVPTPPIVPTPPPVVPPPVTPPVTPPPVVPPPVTLPAEPPASIPVAPPIAPASPTPNKPSLGEVKAAVNKATVEVSHFMQSVAKEVPQKVSNTVSVVGVALPAIAFAVTQPAVAVNVVSIPIRLWNLIPIWLGFRRKKRPWGTVYDSITKQPLDPVYVTLKDTNGKTVASTITDIDGRFGFLVPPGHYFISARKDNYEFPSAKLTGKESDGLYGNLYFNGEIDITGDEKLVIKNIPMDSTSFNWNEFEKSRNSGLMKFFSKRDIFLSRFADVAFYVGTIFSIVALFAAPQPLNYIIFGIYTFVTLIKAFGLAPKKPGYVIEKSTGNPLSYAIMRVYSLVLNQEVAHSIISKTGKYYCLVPNGNYKVVIEKKTGEDEYMKIFESDPLKIRGGFIGKIFKI